MMEVKIILSDPQDLVDLGESLKGFRERQTARLEALYAKQAAGLRTPGSLAGAAADFAAQQMADTIRKDQATEQAAPSPARLPGDATGAGPKLVTDDAKATEEPKRRGRKPASAKGPEPTPAVEPSAAAPAPAPLVLAPGAEIPTAAPDFPEWFAGTSAPAAAAEPIAAPTTATAAPTATATKEQVVKAMRDYMDATSPESVFALLREFGAENVGKLPVESYPVALARVRELMKAAALT